MRLRAPGQPNAEDTRRPRRRATRPLPSPLAFIAQPCPSTGSGRACVWHNAANPKRSAERTGLAAVPRRSLSCFKTPVVTRHFSRESFAGR